VAAIADALDVGEKMTATAIVLEVDQKHRTLTLKDEDGKPFTIQVGDEVRNLAQVKAGDTVVATYRQALAVSLEVVKGTGVNARVVTVSVGRAPKGAMPAGVVEEKVQMVGTILAVDKEKRTVLIQGAVHHVTLKIPADMDIKDLKVGDQVRRPIPRNWASQLVQRPPRVSRCLKSVTNKSFAKTSNLGLAWFNYRKIRLF
jgi:hypothetical protein